ncbi:hypothetical protein EVAR_82309_1 [Eumeta japonica]|uniref:Uncharacterized protein n=1 Tax=Eumeta variegata TaxID=151549 RepID=A0A4C1VX76_EUMVA|nr:hypothetical protein EVAR_82309_1 [Eumeta japonica]
MVTAAHKRSQAKRSHQCVFGVSRRNRISDGGGTMKKELGDGGEKKHQTKEKRKRDHTTIAVLSEPVETQVESGDVWCTESSPSRQRRTGAPLVVTPHDFADIV